MCAPGAARSGRRTASPRLAQDATSKSPKADSSPPTLITNGSCDGEFKPFDAGPSLPAAVTTVIPAAQARSSAAATGSEP